LHKRLDLDLRKKSKSRAAGFSVSNLQGNDYDIYGEMKWNILPAKQITDHCLSVSTSDRQSAWPGKGGRNVRSFRPGKQDFPSL